MQTIIQYIRAHRITSIIVLVFFFGLMALGTVKIQTFRMTSTTPRLTSINNYTPSIQVNFNKPIDGKGISIGPDNVVATTKVSGTALTIYLQTLSANHTYTITIKSIRSTSGKVLTNIPLTFKVAYVASSDNLSDAEKQAISNKQDQKPASLADPILNYLPYSTLTFMLTAVQTGSTQGQSALVIEAQILIPPNTPADQEAIDIPKFKQQAIDYLKSKGIDPTKYNIDYQIVHEELTGA